MVIQLWNDWLARRVLSRRTMSLVSTLRTMNNGHVQNWHRWKFEGTVVWASRSSKAIGQVSAACTYGYSDSVNQRMWGGAGQAPWTILEQRYIHIYRCTSFGSFWAYSEITVVQRGIVGPGCASREANSIGRNCPFTKNELSEKWDLLYGSFQAHGILRWVLYFSFWKNKKWINN